jgi:peroxiredoxin
MGTKAFMRSLPAAGLLGLSVLVVVLGLQHRRVRDENAGLRDRLGRLQAGQYVPELRTAAFEGDSVVIGGHTAGAGQVLIYFTARCQYCDASAPAWKSMIAPLRSNGFEVLALSVGDADLDQAFLRSHELAIPMVRFPAARFASMYRAMSVPQVIVLGNDGRVLHSRLGVLTAQEAADSILNTAMVMASGNAGY